MFAAPDAVRRNWLYWLVFAALAVEIGVNVAAGGLAASLGVLGGDAAAREAYAAGWEAGIVALPPAPMALVQLALFLVVAAAFGALALKRWIAAPLFWGNAAVAFGLTATMAARLGAAEPGARGAAVGALVGAGVQLGLVSLGLWLIFRRRGEAEG